MTMPPEQDPHEAAADGSAAPLEPERIAPAASELPGRADSEGWRRMHPLTPLLKGGLALLVILGIIVANLRDMVIELFVGDEYGGNGFDDLIAEIVANGLILAVLAGIIGLILLIVFFSWLSWRFHSYRVTEEAVENREGILFKKHRRAPLERIQSVNLQRPLLARLLGLTKIEVLTAGQGGKVELAYLGHGDAKTVREQILRSAARSRGATETRPAEGRAPAPGQGSAIPVGSESPDPASAPTARAQDPLPGGVSLDGTPYAQPSSVLDQRLQNFADFDIDAAARDRGVLVSVPVGRLVASLAVSTEMLVAALFVIAIVVFGFIRPIIGVAGLVTLIPLVVVIGSMLIAQFNRGFNFTLTRSSDGVRTSAGLTSTNTETIPLGRIHAVEAMQPLGWRPFGWWKVRINVAGHSVAQGGQNSSRNIVLPVGSADDVVRVFDALLPGTGDAELESAALRNALDGPGAGYTGAGRGAGAVLWFGRGRAGMRLVAGSDAVDENATLRIRRGAVTRSLIVMPILRAQSVQFRRPLLHRMIGLASIQMHSVLGPVRVEMRGIALETARAGFDELARAVVDVQGAEAARRAGGPE